MQFCGWIRLGMQLLLALLWCGGLLRLLRLERLRRRLRHRKEEKPWI